MDPSLGAGARRSVSPAGPALLSVSAGRSVGTTVGATTGFLSAFTVSYVGHFRFSFGAPGRYRDYLLKFAVSSLASFLLSTAAVWVATAILGIDYKPALIALGIIVPVCNYLMNRFWVFLHPRGVSSRSLGIITPE